MTHKVIIRPASNLAQDRESSPVKDQRSTTVLRRQLICSVLTHSHLTRRRRTFYEYSHKKAFIFKISFLQATIDVDNRKNAFIRNTYTNKYKMMRYRMKLSRQ